jgi:predicted ArsR family transcriptional regulator
MKANSSAQRSLELILIHPRTRDQLAAALGLDTRQVKEVVSSLRRRGVVTSTTKKPVIYSLTQRGRYWLDPESDPDRAAKKERARVAARSRQNAYRKARRAIARAAMEQSPEDEFPIEQRIVPAPRFADEFVFTAIQRRPAFQAAWH